MKNKKDLYLAALVGFLVGWLVILPAESFGLAVTPLTVAVSVVGFTLFAIAALLTLTWLNRFWPHFFEIGKFAAVGTLNSFVDLTVLDALMLATGATSGLVFAVVKWGAFVVASVNSYFWNKFWTFESELPVNWSEGVRFAVFTALGAVLNAAVAYIAVTYIVAPSSLSPSAWANIAAVIAIFANMIWNFLTYKRFVFPKNKSLPTDNKSLITDH
jgi:putative flippase GtrA